MLNLVLRKVIVGLVKLWCHRFGTASG